MPVSYYKHPAGNVLINQKMYQMIEPLLKFQKYIKQVGVYKDEIIDVNLDLFREMPINLGFNQAKWYFHVAGIQTDLSTQYIEANKNDKYKNKIILHRTFRYRNNYIKFDFLKDIDNICFIGTEDEYNDIKKTLTKLEHHDCKDFLEMATIINSCKFFIGNSSVAFPIAEGLKTPRLLEASPDFPVLQISGRDGYDFYYQPHFENLFNYLNKKYRNN